MSALLLAALLAQAAPPAPPPRPPPPPPFSAAEVERVVRSHVADVQSCYEQGMAEQRQTGRNAPGGRVTVAFTITTLGTVENERVKHTAVKDPQVTGCILAAVRSWEFPRPDQPQPVEFPFDLKPVSGPKGRKK